MKLGGYHQATQDQVSGIGQFIPDYYFRPPAGSEWARVLQAWDGQPGSLISITLDNGTKLQNWHASCSAQVTIPGNGGNVRDGARINAGDDVSTSYGMQYPYALTSVENADDTLWIAPKPSGDGSVTMLSANGMTPNGIDTAIMAVALIATAVVGGAVVAGAGAMGGMGATGAATGSGEGFAVGGIGDTVDATIPVIDPSSISSAGTLPSEVGQLGSADLTGATTVTGAVSSPSLSDLTSLPSDLQPTATLPGTPDIAPDIAPPDMPSLDLPESAIPSPQDIVGMMPAGDVSALAASAGGIPSASSLLSSGSSLISGSGSLGKAIGSIIGAIAGAHTPALGTGGSSNQEGHAGSTVGAGALVILAAAGTLLYLSQHRSKK